MTVSLNIKLPLSEKSRLDAMMKATNTTEPQPVLSNALRLYEDAIKLDQQGKKLYTKGDNGEFIEYKVFG